MKVHRVEVLWADAAGHPGWFTPEEVADVDLAVIQSIGFLVTKSAKVIRIGMSFNQASGDVGDILTIPRCTVLKMRRIR